MADKFFEETPTETQETPDVFKLGEKEYTQEELSKLVGLGEIARESEEKFKTPIDKVWPSYTKTTQENADLKKELEELKNRPSETVSTNLSDLTPQQKEEALKAADALGIGPNSFRQIVREELAAKDLISDVSSVIVDAKKEGYPETTTEDLLRHMQDTGIKNPAKAYKDLFETELDEIKEKKLATIKPSGMITTQASTAGSKQPEKIAVNKSNLGQIIAEALGGAE